MLVTSPAMVCMENLHALLADLILRAVHLKGRQLWVKLGTAEEALHAAALEMWRLFTQLDIERVFDYLLNRRGRQWYLGY